MALGSLNNISLSVYDHLRDKLIASGLITSGIQPDGQKGNLTYGWLADDTLKRVVTITDFTDAQNEINLPIITFEAGNTEFSPLEIGSKNKIISQIFNVTVYAEDPLQLDRIIGEIIFDLDRTINLKDYNSNFTNPSTISKLHLDIDSVRIFRVRNNHPNTALRNQAEMLFKIKDK